MFQWHTCVTAAYDIIIIRLYFCTSGVASIPGREEKGGLAGIPCMRMRVHYPKKGVICVFVD